MITRRQTIAIVAAVLLVAVGTWLWRWQLGGGAFRIVEPAVRRWAVSEVARLSDSTYALSLSPIRVVAGQGRVSFDLLELETVAAANARRDAPLPTVSLQLHGCAVQGIELDRLASGGGLRAASAGCDSAVATVRVPRGVARDTTSSTAFLSLRDTLQLPISVPSFAFELVEMPSVRFDLHIAHASGDSTTLTFDRLAVTFDSVAWDPRVAPEQRPTLLSRDVLIRMTEAEGARGNDHMTVAGLEASLARGHLRLDDLAWTPVAGARADSLGVAGVTIDTLALDGVDWEAALTAGDVLVRTVNISGVRLATIRRTTATRTASESSSPWTLHRFLRALHRAVVVDSAIARDVVVDYRGDAARTEAERITLTGLRSAEGMINPGGQLRLAAEGLRHAWQDHRATIASLAIDLPKGRVDFGGIGYRTEGTDAQFAARRRWRQDRITASAASIGVRALDGARWAADGSYRAGALRIDGLTFDILSDKQLPSNPAPERHRTPQAWLRTAPVAVRLDTVIVHGKAIYRERDEETGVIGEMRFEDLRASLARVTTGAGTSAGPIRFLATTRLMGIAPFQLEVNLPRSAGFDMTWSGRLGAMPAAGLNPMLVAVGDFTFAKGDIDWIAFEAETHDGFSSGTVQPRYRNLEVRLPGIGRTGALGGVRRAIAGMVANTFVVRGDNHAGGGSEPKDGRIAHQWEPDQTLVKHLWDALRKGLGEVLAP